MAAVSLAESGIVTVLSASIYAHGVYKVKRGLDALYIWRYRGGLGSIPPGKELIMFRRAASPSAVPTGVWGEEEIGGAAV